MVLPDHVYSERYGPFHRRLKEQQAASSAKAAPPEIDCGDPWTSDEEELAELGSKLRETYTVPLLPDECLLNIFSHFNTYDDFRRLAMVHRTWRKVIREHYRQRIHISPGSIQVTLTNVSNVFAAGYELVSTARSKFGDRGVAEFYKLLEDDSGIKSHPKYGWSSPTRKKRQQNRTGEKRPFGVKSIPAGRCLWDSSPIADELENSSDDGTRHEFDPDREETPMTPEPRRTRLRYPILLDFRNADLTSRCCPQLSTLLSIDLFHNIVAYCLPGNELDDNAASILAEGLQNHAKLRILDISGNRMSSRGVSAIFDACVAKERGPSRSLRHLHCCRMKAVDDRIRGSTAQLVRKCKRLEVFTLSHLALTDVALSVIATALAEPHGIHHLSIAGNLVGHEGMLALASAIKMSITAFQNVDISLNRQAGPDAIEAIFEVAKFNEYLHTLSASSLLCGDGPVEALGSVLMQSNALAILDLSNNALTDLSAEYIAIALGCHQTCRLRKLNLSRNSIGDRGAVALAAPLRSGRCTLKALDISGNKINAGAVAIICSGSLQKSALTSLDLSQNSINDDTFFHIASEFKAAQRRPKLKVLRLGANVLNIRGHNAWQDVRLRRGWRLPACYLAPGREDHESPQDGGSKKQRYVTHFEALTLEAMNDDMLANRNEENMMKTQMRSLPTPRTRASARQQLQGKWRQTHPPPNSKDLNEKRSSVFITQDE